MARCKRIHKIIFLILCITYVIILIFKVRNHRPNLKLYQRFGVLKQETKLYKLACHNVLDKMAVGYWVRKDFSQEEMDEVKSFHRKVRAINGMPQSLQREDRRCGTVHLNEERDDPTLKWFRALCDPDGTSPCCFKHKCIVRSLEKCKCRQCYDVRQQIHAELFTWFPVDPTCKITRFLGEHDTCSLLQGVTIYFIGDSFMLELYVAILSLLRSKKPRGLLKKNTPPEKLEQCDRFFISTNECKSFIVNDERECNNTTRLRRISFWKAQDTIKAIEFIGELKGLSNSFVIFGAGIHEGFNASIVENQIVEPILNYLARSPWPKPIWLASHSPGILKAPKFFKQRPGYVAQYNLKINAILKKRGIPILDFFQLTKGVMSYDGTHYGPGVNDVKAQIFLNYILEIKSKMTIL